MKSRRQQSVGGGDATSSGGGGGCNKMERKDVEKNRRLHMKGLCLKLSSLVPAAHHHHSSSFNSSSPPSSNSKDAATQLDQLDSAAAYIRQLKSRIEELRRRKQSRAGNGGCSSSSSGIGDIKPALLPVVEVRQQEKAAVDVALVSEAGKPFKLHEVIAVLEEEGAEVVSASFSAVADKIFYTLHSQTLCPRIGLDAARVAHRLRALAAP